MPSGDDDLIRNGTLSQWWSYTVVIGGSAGGEYGSISGGLRIKGKYLVIAAFLLGAVVGALVG